MLIQRRSILTGKVRTRDIPVSEEQFSSWKDGVLIQDAMPHLSDEEREFILSGITSQEWDDEYGDEC